jgi:hypothetical protein
MADPKIQTVPQRIIATGNPNDVALEILAADGKTPLLKVTGDGKVALFGGTPVAKGAALSAAAVAPASFTHTTPGADDFAFANTINASAWGFSSQNEANSLLKAVQNAILRISELEARMVALGFIA